MSIGAPAPASLRPPLHRLALVFLILAVFASGFSSLASGVAIKAKASLAQVLLERAWRSTLEGNRQAKPWPWADIHPVALIEAPRLKSRAIALSGVSGQALAFGPGLLDGAPAPGELGLSIIAAHRDTHFHFLRDIAVGDQIYVTTGAGERLAFTVEESRIVDSRRSGLYTDGPGRRIALVTCWPFDATMRGTLRLGVIARLDQP